MVYTCVINVYNTYEGFLKKGYLQNHGLQYYSLILDDLGVPLF